MASFDTLNHDLLIAKLHSGGFQHDALKPLLSYLSKQWHTDKVNRSFSWALLFNLYLIDFFFLPTLRKFIILQMGKCFMCAIIIETI